MDEYEPISKILEILGKQELSYRHKHKIIISSKQNR